jgi:hypothetical protein
MPIVNAESPFFNSITPSNGATDVEIHDATDEKYVTISVNITDSDSDLKYYILQTNKTGAWVTLDSYELPTPLRYYVVTKKVYNCSYEDMIFWRLLARDNTSDWTNHTFYFTTQDEPEENGGSGEVQTGNISLFPAIPTSGKLFAVIIDKPIDAYGYLWVKNTMYPIAVTKGFGTVETPQEIYGEGLIWLYGGMKKTFTIASGLTGSLSVTVPDTVVVDSAFDIQVKIGGKLVGYAELQLTDPTGKTITINTSTGIVNQVFDKVGTWIVRTSLNNQNDVKEITVTYKQLSVSTDEAQYTAGDDVTVTTEDGALVSISSGGIIKIQSIATNGVVMFTPRDPGDYKVTATSGNKQGTETFNVYQNVRIQIIDTETNAQVTTLKANKNYVVKLVDSRDQLIYNFQSIYTSDSLSSTIPLSSGMGFWIPKKSGIITLSIEQLEGYMNEPLTVTVEGTTDILIPIIIIIIVVVVLLLLFYFRSKLPQGLRDKFKLKPKREIPV